MDGTAVCLSGRMSAFGALDQHKRTNQSCFKPHRHLNETFRFMSAFSARDQHSGVEGGTGTHTDRWRTQTSAQSFGPSAYGLCESHRRSPVSWAQKHKLYLTLLTHPQCRSSSERCASFELAPLHTNLRTQET